MYNWLRVDSSLFTLHLFIFLIYLYFRNNWLQRFTYNISF